MRFRKAAKLWKLLGSWHVMGFIRETKPGKPLSDNVWPIGVTAERCSGQAPSVVLTGDSGLGTFGVNSMINSAASTTKPVWTTSKTPPSPGSVLQIVLRLLGFQT